MATWVIHTISVTSYWGIVFLMIVENVCPPIKARHDILYISAELTRLTLSAPA
jgi:hypothetical protein